MRRLHAQITPLSHLSYRGSLPRARVEQGFFRETSRISSFSEELFRIRVGEKGDHARQLNVARDSDSLHLIQTSNRNFYLTTFLDNGAESASQEQKLVLNLGDSIPGNGQHGTQLKLFKGDLALYLPTWDSVFLFGPNGGRCDTIRLGTMASAFSPRRLKAHENFMHTNASRPGSLIFTGPNSLRILEDDELISLDLSSSVINSGFPFEIRPFGQDEFIAFSSSGSNKMELAMIKRISKVEFSLNPVRVQRPSHDLSTRYWDGDKVAWSPDSYLEVLSSTSKSETWNVLVSPRDITKDGPSALFERWAKGKSVLASVSRDSRVVEIVDLESKQVRTIPVQLTQSPSESTNVSETSASAESVAVRDSKVFVLMKENSENYIRCFESKAAVLEASLSDWRKMWGLPDPSSPRWGMKGEGRGETKESTSPPEAKNPKHGKVDDEFHAGGNTFAGGTGGADTAGLGGRGGPYRLDKGHKIHQVSDELKRQVDKNVLAKARELGKIAWEERLKEIRMDSRAHNSYVEARSRVETDLERLKAVLESAAIIKKERVWERNQPYGELDDSRLVDGLVGEKLIYKRRIKKEPPPGSPSSTLNVRVVADVSGSMYRFQSLDGRLQRMLDTILMLFEAISGLDHRYRVSLAGHSGESPNVSLVDWDKVPDNEGAIYRVLETMAAHSQFCISGDHTVEAVYAAVEDLLEQDKENGGLAIIVSDANLRRYGIAPSDLAKAMMASENVKTHVIFIASVRDEAEMLVRELPFGRAKVCLETSDLPHVMRDILADASSQI